LSDFLYFTGFLDFKSYLKISIQNLKSWFYTILLIAIGLSFDSFAVATSSGILLKDIIFRDAMKISFSLAFFQGLFTLIGWLAGSGVRPFIEHIHYWVAFGLLLFIGLKMIWESLKK